MARILIVEDDPAVLEMLAACLRGSGYEVQEARDWSEASERLREARPDLAIIDYMLPDVSGKGIYDRLQGMTPTKDMPVIFITGAYRIPEMLPLRSRTKFMRKPVDMRHLHVHIKTLLAGPPPPSASTPSIP